MTAREALGLAERAIRWLAEEGEFQPEYECEHGAGVITGKCGEPHCGSRIVRRALKAIQAAKETP
jgi:hypothetical protein